MRVVRALVAEASRHRELARAFLREGPCRARAIVRDELDHACASGEIALADTAAAAELLCDMAYASPLDWLLDPDAPAPSATTARDRLKLAVGIFLDGARRRGAATAGRPASP